MHDIGKESVRAMIHDIPFRVLFVGFATVTDWLCPELNETVVELTVSPIEPLLESDNHLAK